MKRFTFCLAFFGAILFFSNSLNAQDYKSAIGVRLGVPLSVSYKQFISDQGAFEVTGGYRLVTTDYSFLTIAASYQHHNAINSVSGLKWYYGAGASLNFWSYPDYYKTLGVNASTTTIGIFGLIGLDYKFADYPINLSLDWAPTYYIGSGYVRGFYGGYGALSVRYTLN